MAFLSAPKALSILTIVLVLYSSTLMLSRTIISPSFTLEDRADSMASFFTFLVQRISVTTGFRAQSNAAVSPLGSSDGALSRVAGAFLSPGFAAAASDFGSGQGGLGALALVGQVINHRSMHYHAVGFDSEYGIGKGDIADHFAGHIIYVYIWHRASSFPYAFLTLSVR